MFGEPQRTPYDLNFSVLGFPVRVSPWFWLIAVLLGQPAMQGGIKTLLPWLLAVFLSILIHELGHTLAFRHYGIPSRIVLHQIGGVAIPESRGGGWNSHSQSPWAGLVVSAAGPALQMLAGLLVIFVVRLTGHRVVAGIGAFGVFIPLPNADPLTVPILPDLLGDFVWISIVWAIFNLMPIFPLDGGQITRNLMIMSGMPQPLQTSLCVSVLAAGAGAFYAYQSGNFFMMLMLASLGYSSFQALQHYGDFGSGWTGRG